MAGSIAQRVVRRICPDCKKVYTPSVEEKAVYEKYLGESVTELYHGTGCNTCSDTGYLGRLGVYEVMTVTDAIKSLMLSGASISQIRNQAIEDGMVPLMRDGMLKLKEGLTTISEILKNVYSLNYYSSVLCINVDRRSILSQLSCRLK